MANHPSIYHAVFRMTQADEVRYKAEWIKRYPRKKEFWTTAIEPYLKPRHMLFSAPPLQVVELLKLVAENNNLEMPWYNAIAKTITCKTCGLSVTYVDNENCLKCAEKLLTD